ncbi:MAG: hypothetical protein ACYSPI_03920, partial [Planctomycetota bacterium]
AVEPNFEQDLVTEPVILETGQTVKTSDGKVYLYQGEMDEAFNFSDADFSDSSKWVEAIETPDYADGKAYTIKYELVKDTDVELVQNYDVVKVVTDKDGVLLAKGGTVGHLYLYIGESAELVLREQDYSNGDLWRDVTTTPNASATYESSFLNYSVVVQRWTTGGGWLRFKTIHLLTTKTEGEKDYYTHTLKADYPIEISFIQGPASPSINIHTKRDLYLQGTITSPQGGAITLTAGDSVIFAEKAAVLGTSPTINAGGSVRANVEGGDTSNGTFQTAGLVQDNQIQNNQQVLNIASENDIELRVVYDPDGNQSSTIIVGQVSSTRGNVILYATGGIQPLDGTSLISGNRIELYTGSGAIGSQAMPLQVDSDVVGSGGVAARADGDIFIREIQGDLKLALAQPQPWDDVQASIHSKQGDVALEVNEGSVLDALYEEFRPRTQEEADALDQKLQLTGQQARDAAEASIRAEENTQTQLYHTYWETYRYARPSQVEHEIWIETINAVIHEIRFSQAHGLQTGDQIFFSVGVDLGTEDFGDTSRWTEIVPDYDLQTIPGTVVLETDQIVRTLGGTLYRYLAEHEEDVNLADEDFNDVGRWARMVPDYDMETLATGSRVMLQTEQVVRTSEGAFYQYQGESAYLPYANLESGFAYYAVVIDATTIQLALSRFDAAISENPIVLDIKIEGADDVVLFQDQGDFSHVYMLEFTYSYDALQQDPSELDERYQNVHETYGDEAYDPNFIYQVSAEERQERIANRTFSFGVLRYQISKSLFSFLYPDAEGAGGGVEPPAETPNIIANHVTLKAGGENSQIGRVTGIIVIDLSEGFENLSAEHQEILTYAGVNDVLSVTYMQGPLGENTNEIENLTLQVWNDIDVEASGSVVIVADQDVVLQTEGTLIIDRIQAGGDVRITAGGGILNDKSGGQNIISTRIRLFAGLGIGEADHPMSTDVRYIQSESKTGSTWIMNTGALVIGDFDVSDTGMSSGGSIILSASSSITVAEDLTAMDEIILTAEDSSGPSDDLLIV